MRGALLAVTFLLVGVTGALSDVQPQPLVGAPVASADNAAPAAAATLIHAQGNNCATAHYPATAIRLNHQGSTTITVHIDETGKVSGADVTQSSGFDDLDQASVDCAKSNWHFTPATQNGKPVASTKQYRIVWKLTDGNTPPMLKADAGDACNAIFASAKIRWPAYRAATLQFRVSSTGVVQTPFVAISSGDQLFDAQAVQCMTKVGYFPAQVNGAPTDVSWTAAVLWSPHTGLAFANGRDVGPYCPDSDFPASMWKGDPPNPTDISFQTIYGPLADNYAIEQESGNSELDQAALTCLKARVPATSQIVTAMFSGIRQDRMLFGALVRFNWRDGHAFPLFLRGN